MQLGRARELGYYISLDAGRQEGQRRGRAARRPVAAAVFRGRRWRLWALLLHFAYVIYVLPKA